MRRQHALVWVALALVLALAGWALWRPGGADGAPDAAAAGPPGGAFVPSMQGTQPDADLAALQSVTPAGLFRPAAYAQLLRLFDYYLSAVGEASMDAITQRIGAELDQSLPQPQAREAKRLLSMYLAFKRALADLEQDHAAGGTGVQAIRQRMLAMQQLRERYFSEEEIQGMFGFEDSYDQDALARLEISQNASLSAAQKKAQLEALDASLPEALRQQRDASQALLKTQQQAEALRAKGASEDEIYRLRSQAFGTQAASRLAEVDRDEQAWQARIASYLGERSALMGSTPEAQRQQALAQLQQSRFSAEERRRLAAYEK